MNLEQMLAQPMIICSGCGWEMYRGQVVGVPMCDDCSLDSQIEHNKEQGITV